MRVETDEAASTLILERSDTAGSRAVLFCNCAPKPAIFQWNAPDEPWTLALWTGAPAYGGDPDAQLPPSQLNTYSGCVSLDGHSAALFVYGSPGNRVASAT